MAYLVGITGGIGGGKSTVAGYLTEAGAVVIDTDMIAREITQPGAEALDEIRDVFGDSVFTLDGSLNRKAMAEIVFNDTEKLTRLNAILHPRIRQKWQAEAEQAKAPYVFVVVPLLYENDLASQFDEVWVVTTDEEERVRRVMERDGVDRESVLNRMRNQLPEKDKVTSADFVIDTTSGYEATKTAAETCLSELKRRLGLERKRRISFFAMLAVAVVLTVAFTIVYIGRAMHPVTLISEEAYIFFDGKTQVVTGVYRVKNRLPVNILIPLDYSFAVESGLGDVANVVISLEESMGEHALGYLFSEKGVVSFELALPPFGEGELIVNYRQPVFGSKLAYIVKSTDSWETVKKGVAMYLKLVEGYEIAEPSGGWIEAEGTDWDWMLELPGDFDPYIEIEIAGGDEGS